jgi:hypothetical protein
VHQILGINIVAYARLSIETRSRELAGHVEAGFRTHHDECTEPRTKLIPLLQASVRARRCGLHWLAGSSLRNASRGHDTRSAASSSVSLWSITNKFFVAYDERLTPSRPAKSS